jgi:hypothetical protein
LRKNSDSFAIFAAIRRASSCASGFVFSFEHPAARLKNRHLWFWRVLKVCVLVMQARRQKEKRSDWWLTVEQIGRELRKIYPPVDVLDAFGVASRSEIRNWNDRQLDAAVFKLRGQLLKTHDGAPLDFYSSELKERWAKDRKVKTPEGEVTVVVPSDEEEEEETEQTTAAATKPPEARQSIQTQAKLAEIGAIMGFKIWVPRMGWTGRAHAPNGFRWGLRSTGSTETWGSRLSQRKSIIRSSAKA